MYALKDLWVRLSTEHTGLIKSFLVVCVLPQSSVCVPPFSLSLVGFLQQTDNRAPAGLPVHLTGHDSSHAGLSIPSPSHALFIFDFSVLPTRPTLCLQPSLFTKLSTVCRYRKNPSLVVATSGGVHDILVVLTFYNVISLFSMFYFPECITTDPQTMIVNMHSVMDIRISANIDSI